MSCALTAASPGGELRLTIQAEPKTLDPLMAADEPSELVRHLTAGVLIRMNRATQMPEAALAESWRVAPDGRGITFRLRAGVTFSDGTPFDGADVCHTFARLVDPATDSPAAESFRFSTGKTTCRAAGGTVTLQFPAVLAGAERLFDAVPILSSRSTLKERAVLGPFVVAEFKPGSYLLLTRNERYWKRGEAGAKLPHLDAIRLDIQRNRDFELLRFRRGELHVINNLDPDSFERLKAEMPAAVRDLGVSLDTEQIWFNQLPGAPISAQKKAWFRSAAFRLAVSDAINRQDLARIVYRGHAAPAFGPISPANRLWVNAAAKEPSGGAAAALDRLRKDGFQLRGKTLTDSGGNPVEFSIVTNAGNKSRERMAAMIQADVAAIGMRVTVVPLDFPSLIDRIAKTFNYDACLLGLVHDDLDPNSQMNVWRSSAGQHQWNPNQKQPATAWEAEMDRLMQMQAATTDGKKRKEAFDRVQQIVAEQAPFIYLVYRNSLVAVAPAVHNIQPGVLRPQLLWSAERIQLNGPVRASR